ncbi:MAG: dihydroorotate dehydrogenase-like protein [Paludibacter sp.]|nr:dihydroorotate dehydrogenase-like protein [Paludibacter sp.]
MGIEIDNPIIVGATNLMTNFDNIKKAEDNGAGAIVYKSLFEEQIQLERFQLDEKLSEFNEIHAEMITNHPHLDHNIGADEYLMQIVKAKESISIPLIASLNAVKHDTWVKYAKLLSETGVDGIELNFYQNLLDFNRTSKEIEDEQIAILKEIKQSISIPVSVKLSSEYTNTLNFIKNIDDVGIDTFVLFNSFFQPDIDIETEKHVKSFNISKPGDYKQSLRIAGILYGNINAEVCSSRGIFTGADVVKLILSGASCVQVVSTLYKNGFTQIDKIKQEIAEWMELKSYNSIADFKGKLSKNALRNCQ